MDKSIRAAKHLGPMDDAAVAAVRLLADAIDTASHNEAELAKASFGTIPTFLKGLAALGLTPEARKVIGGKEAPEGGKLAQMRGTRR